MSNVRAITCWTLQGRCNSSGIERTGNGRKGNPGGRYAARDLLGKRQIAHHEY
jgi:hypothetical protein